MTAAALLQVLNQLVYLVLTAAVISRPSSILVDRPDLGVVYMSGYSGDLVMRDSKLDGPLVTKPFTRESLLVIVRAAVADRVRTKGSPVPTA